MLNEIGAEAPKIQHYQTVMLESDMDELMKATGDFTHSGALSTAAREYVKRAQKKAKAVV